ncbi:glutamate [NMDA] receptor subunit 1-like [Palaemon carinicauda]|uniref:glutamate [NMDA] receptor subunit 1-like n=1 Tax=Palaemon carinicauda TaxID=392227 RepID=UPI0035B5E809
MKSEIYLSSAVKSFRTRTLIVAPMTSSYQAVFLKRVTVASLNDGNISLWEAYQFEPNFTKKVVHVGRWLPPSATSQQDGILEVPNPDVIPRRSDLTGYHLRCSFLPHIPLNSRRIIGNLTVYEGIADSIWLELQRTLNFSFECTEPEDKLYGTYIKGKWTGIIADLVQGRADVTINLLSAAPDRASVVDFSFAFYKDSWVIGLKKNRIYGSSWMSYINEFSWDSWLLTAVLIPVASVVLLLTAKFSPYEVTIISNSDAFSLVLGSVACQGWWVDLHSISTRTVLAITMVTSSLLYYHYTAILTSSLATPSLGLPFSDLKGFYDARKDYKLVTLKGSVYRTLFMTDIGRNVLMKVFQSQIIWNDMIHPFPENMVDTVEEAYRAVDKGFTGFSTTMSVFRHLTAYDCQYAYIPVQHSHQWRAFALRKGTYIKDVIDRVLLKMVSSGLTDRYRLHFETPKECNASEKEQYGLDKVVSAFLLLLALLACTPHSRCPPKHTLNVLPSMHTCTFHAPRDSYTTDQPDQCPLSMNVERDDVDKECEVYNDVLGFSYSLRPAYATGFPLPQGSETV